MESHTTTETKIEEFLLPLLEGTDIFITAIRIKPTNNIKVFLDADSGLNIGKCATLNRKLYHLIEDAQMWPEGDFSLEVSSPGIDEPLVNMRQYMKNVGRTVTVTPLEGEEVTGILKSVTEEQLELEIKVGKKKEISQVEIPLSLVKKIVVQITF